MMISKIVVFGREIELPRPMNEDELTESRVISLLRDLDPELAREVENSEHKSRVEGDSLVIYRSSAIFG